MANVDHDDINIDIERDKVDIGRKMDRLGDFDGQPESQTHEDIDDMPTDEATLLKFKEMLQPSGKQVQKGLKYFDIAVKLEKLLYELHSFLYWSSLVEAFGIVISILMFLKFTEQLKINMLFLPHLPRCILGFQLNKSIPRSHNIIN